MPQDPNLYGQRPAKKQKKEIALSGSLNFSSQLSSLISTPSSSISAPATAASGRARPSKTKDDIFSVKAKRKTPLAAEAATAIDAAGAKLKLRETHGTEDEKRDFLRAKRNMEEKARLYNAMKRGDYLAKDGERAPLVDFDAKWAQTHPETEGGGGAGDGQAASSSGSDNDDDEDEREMIEYRDEYGRTRRGTRAEAERVRRREQRRALGQAELEEMTARPREPTRLIFGDVIQERAFDLDDTSHDRMEALAARRDKSPTPPPDTHYDATWEIRTKGVGFFQFSQDEAARKKEMENLEKDRAETERVRKEREAERERRRKEIEERRRKIGDKRKEREKGYADSFLEGLGKEMLQREKSAAPGEEKVDPMDGDSTALESVKTS